MLDFFLATLVNIKGVSGVFFWVAIIANIVTIIWFFCMLEENSVTDKDWEKWRRWKKLWIVVTLVLVPFKAIPNMEELWHVRINMLKFHAVSPSNVEAFAKNGMPHIERVAKKIECKFLGCPDDEKEKLGVKESPKASSNSKATEEIAEKVVKKVTDKIVEEVTK